MNVWTQSSTGRRRLAGHRAPRRNAHRWLRRLDLARLADLDYRDITARTREPISQIVSLGIGAVLPLVGLPIYMALGLGDAPAGLRPGDRAGSDPGRHSDGRGLPELRPRRRSRRSGSARTVVRRSRTRARVAASRCCTPGATAALRHASCNRRRTPPLLDGRRGLRRAERAALRRADARSRCGAQPSGARHRWRPRARARASAGHGRLTRALRVFARRQTGRPLGGRFCFRANERGR